MQDIQERVQRIFRDVLTRPDLTIVAESTPQSVPGWDSFNHVNLIIAIEEEFEIVFTTREIGTLTSVGEFLRLIAAKTSEQPLS